MEPKKDAQPHDVVQDTRSRLDDTFGKMGSHLAERRRARLAEAERERDRPRRDLDQEF
jgi:hypothetical protein